MLIMCNFSAFFFVLFFVHNDLYFSTMIPKQKEAIQPKINADDEAS